ncbi:amino acid adenylation domain-containing protein [Streptomyces sp. NPDC048442]|uniref:amino acid adenylation domain-containing protein n=1 Tax=Streptomyces sp. NPDC048442 TaxID=3154823 RepID=UPI00341E8443
MHSGRTLHEIFEERAARFPDRTAVSCGTEHLDYATLDARADRLARRIAGTRQGSGSLIGLCADRGIELIVGLLAILKAGAGYVPLDPGYPAERLDHLLADTQVDLVLALDRTASAVASADVPVLLIDGPDSDTAPDTAQPSVGAESLAYVIHTSGSTGLPKGTLVEHRNVVALMEQGRELFGFDENDVWTLLHSVSFDFSVWEIWGALLHGGRLVVVPAETARSPRLLRELLVDNGVTVLNQTPSAFRGLAAVEAEHGGAELPLRLVMFGGERLDVKQLGPWLAAYGDDRPQLVNMYGITETTVHVTHRRIRTADLDEPDASPIGVPLPGVRIKLLDASGEPVADGVQGEMWVGGTGVARGYLLRPELTEERFCTLDDGERWYRSGDLAKRTADGGYCYLGRTDDQVKIRGYRIEPGEIERLLSTHAGVTTAIVTPEDHGEGDVRILAYLVPPPGTEVSAEAARTLAAELSELAARALPAYMHPSAYRLVPEVPLTPQGKADRRALDLLPYAEAFPAGGRGGELTGTGVEIMRLVTEVLGGSDCLGSDDDLFSAGVTSLAFTRIIVLVNRRYGLTLTGAELEEATVNGLADCVDAQTAGRK